MLRGIHKASANWLGKAVLTIIMGFLAISFAIWGIGDIFRGFGRSTVAKIGGTEISIEQFRMVYNERLQQISRQAGRPISSEQARQLGLDRQIAGQLVAEAALDERARQLGLNLSNAEIARQIMTDPTFRGPSGAFDRLRFEQLIRNANYSEARYTQEQRRIALRRQIADSIGGSVTVPKTAADALNRYGAEQRSIEYVALDRAQAGDIAPPTPEVLAKYYEDHKAMFRAPEYRSLILLSLMPADLAPWIEVSEADAKRAYEDRKARYVTPERRQVQQIVFPKADEAKAAAERLAGGMTFAQLAAERNLTDKDIDLGLLTKSAMVDRAVADAAFSLKQGETSAPVAGQFGTVLAHVTKIEPEAARSYEEVAPEIKHEIALERARAEVVARHDKIEDERAAGLRLDEIGKKFGLEARTITAIDRSGRTPSGEPVQDLPRGVDVIPAAFAAQVGVETDPLQLPGNGFAWFDVVSVEPSRERSFEEVKDRVAERWREEQQAAVLKAKADALADKLKSGTPLAELATATGVEPKTATELRRGSARALPAKVIEEVFRTDKDAVASAEGDSATQRIVFRVTDIKIPLLDPASAEARQMTEQLRRALSDDLVAQYIVWLEKDLGASINNEALSQVVGGERN